MKIKDNYILREVAGENLVVPLGEAGINFNSVITVNETGKFLWEQLSGDITQEQLTAALLNEYDVDEITAARDVESFVKSLKDNEILED